jgi:hypothetical protein
MLLLAGAEVRARLMHDPTLADDEVATVAAVQLVTAA